MPGRAPGANKLIEELERRAVSVQGSVAHANGEVEKWTAQAATLENELAELQGALTVLKRLDNAVGINNYAAALEKQDAG